MTQASKTPATVIPAAEQTQQVAKKEQSLVDATLQKINELDKAGSLQVPKDYSAPNALRSAWLILQDIKNKEDKPVLSVCTKESIANTLLKMVVQGLNPMKRQCSFIAYGNQLTLQREYQGSVAIAKRYGLKNIVANAIFEGDEFTFEVDNETGRKKIVKHVSPFDSYGGTVKGAYAIVEMSDGSKNVEVMNMKQIQAAWNQGATRGQSPAHKNFPDQMACKTVINRAVKGIINSSDDSDLFDDDPITQTESITSADVKNEIAENANTGEAIGFTDAQDVTDPVINEPVIASTETKKAPF